MNPRFKILAELYAIKFGLYFLFISCLFTYSWFINKIFECMIVLATYTLLRWCFPRTWHHHKTLNCITYSIIGFCIFTTLTLPLSMSICSGVVVGLLVTYFLYKIQTYIEFGIAKAKQKTIYDLTKDELYALMENSTLSQEEKDAVEYRVIYHYKGKRWYQAVGYSKRNCQYLIKRAEEKLNNLIEQ